MKTAKRPVGRPRFGDDLMSVRAQFKCTPKELRRLHKEANKAGMPFSEWARAVLLNSFR